MLKLKSHEIIKKNRISYSKMTIRDITDSEFYAVTIGEEYNFHVCKITRDKQMLKSYIMEVFHSFETNVVYVLINSFDTDFLYDNNPHCEKYEYNLRPGGIILVSGNVFSYVF